MNILMWAFRSFKNPCFLDIVILALVSDNFATKMFCLLQFVILYDLFSKLPSSNFHLEFLHKTFIIEYLKTGKNYDSINQIQDWIWIFCLKVFWISSFSNKFLCKFNSWQMYIIQENFQAENQIWRKAMGSILYGTTCLDQKYIIC